MFLHGPAHSFDLLPAGSDQYMADHPEWFGMRDGKRVPQNFIGAQFCWSNAEARRQFIDNVETFVQACPQLRHPVHRALRRRAGLRVPRVQEGRGRATC